MSVVIVLEDMRLVIILEKDSAHKHPWAELRYLKLSLKLESRFGSLLLQGLCQ